MALRLAQARVGPLTPAQRAHCSTAPACCASCRVVAAPTPAAPEMSATVAGLQIGAAAAASAGAAAAVAHPPPRKLVTAALLTATLEADVFGRSAGAADAATTTAVRIPKALVALIAAYGVDEPAYVVVNTSAHGLVLVGVGSGAAYRCDVDLPDDTRARLVVPITAAGHEPERGVVWVLHDSDKNRSALRGADRLVVDLSKASPAPPPKPLPPGVKPPVRYEYQLGRVSATLAHRSATALPRRIFFDACAAPVDAHDLHGAGGLVVAGSGRLPASRRGWTATSWGWEGCVSLEMFRVSADTWVQVSPYPASRERCGLIAIPPSAYVSNTRFTLPATSVELKTEPQSVAFEPDARFAAVTRACEHDAPHVAVVPPADRSRRGVAAAAAAPAIAAGAAEAAAAAAPPAAVELDTRRCVFAVGGSCNRQHFSRTGWVCDLSVPYTPWPRDPMAFDECGGGTMRRHKHPVRRDDGDADEEEAPRLVETPAVGSKWRAIANMRFARSEFGCTAVRGHIVAVGGMYQPKGCGQFTSTARCEVYDPQRNVWFEISRLPRACRNHAAVTVDDRYVYAVGGYSDSTLYVLDMERELAHVALRDANSAPDEAADIDQVACDAYDKQRLESYRAPPKPGTAEEKEFERIAAGKPSGATRWSTLPCPDLPHVNDARWAAVLPL